MFFIILTIASIFLLLFEYLGLLVLFQTPIFLQSSDILDYRTVVWSYSLRYFVSSKTFLMMLATVVACSLMTSGYV